MKTKLIYYHIQKINKGEQQWFPGDEYCINSSNLNNYQKGILLGLGDIRKDKKGEESGLVKYVGEQLYEHSSDLNIEELQYSCHDLRSSLMRYIKWIQEDIFEKVRLEKFPNLPSRKSCLWICTFDQLNHWIEILKKTNLNCRQQKIKILSLSIDGICHEVDANFLDADTHNIEYFESAAINYWSGKLKYDNEIEILFQGNVKVLNEYNSIDEIK